MKNVFILTSLILLINIIPINAQYQSVNIQTPRGVSVAALKFTGTDFSDSEIDYWNYYWTNGYNCRILANSTNYFNCHGYAWYDIEGHMSQSDLLWINDVDQYGNPTNNVTKYYSGVDPSYTQVTTVTNHLRVSYYPRDHSAVTTQDQDSVISKWAYGPLVKHTLASCPFYPNSQIRYYRLIAGIEGSTTALCSNQQATFTSFTSIPGSTYSWSKTDALLDYVSGSGTTSYTVKGKSGSGAATVNLQMTTPSGEVASPNVPKYLWIGPPIVSYISGPYGSNPLSYYSMPTPDYGAGISYTWSLSPSGSLYYWMDHADVTLSDPGYYVLGTQASNSCGTTGWVYTYINYGGFLLSPNPASDEVTVTVNINKSSEQDNPAISSSNYTISIFNSSGVLCGQYKRSGSRFTLPISGLRDGQYYIKINNGKVESIKQLIVKH
jgi:hypothetical protein